MFSTKPYFVFLLLLSLKNPWVQSSAFGKSNSQDFTHFFTVSQKRQQITVTHSNKNRKMVIGDSVCITTDLETIPTYTTCGVLKAFTNGRLTLVDPLKGERKPGAKQLASLSDQKRAADSQSEVVMNRSFPIDWSLGAGVTAGNNYLFSQINFERRISPEITLGVMPLLSMASTSDSKITAYGGFLTATYYFTRQETLTGIFGRMGVGVYSVELKDSQTAETLNNWGGMMLGGYRGSLGKGVTASAGLGLQYLKKPGTNSNKLTYEGLLPLVTAELGYRF